MNLPPEISIIQAGSFSLDPGALFGITPREVWSRHFHPNGKERVDLTCNLLLVKDEHGSWLIDSGLSDSYGQWMNDFFEIKPSADFWKMLDDAAPEGIDHFVLSHLHFDHSGRAIDYRFHAKTRGKGEIICQELEIREMRRPNPLEKNSYPTSMLRRVRFRALQGSSRLSTSLRTILTGGHTAGHQVIIYRGPREIIYFGDLVPTAFHARLTHISAIDNHPMDTLRMKKLLIRKAIRDQALCVFNHDWLSPTAVLSGDPEKPKIESVFLQ